MKIEFLHPHTFSTFAQYPCLPDLRLWRWECEATMTEVSATSMPGGKQARVRRLRTYVIAELCSCGFKYTTYMIQYCCTCTQKHFAWQDFSWCTSTIHSAAELLSLNVPCWLFKGISLLFQLPVSSWKNWPPHLLSQIWGTLYVSWRTNYVVETDVGYFAKLSRVSDAWFSG